MTRSRPLNDGCLIASLKIQADSPAALFNKSNCLSIGLIFEERTLPTSNQWDDEKIIILNEKRSATNNVVLQLGKYVPLEEMIYVLEDNIERSK